MPNNTPFKEERTSSLLRELAANFIQKESGGHSMITITRIRHLGHKIVFLVSVLPEDKTDTALEFLKRKRSELHSFLQENSRIWNIPLIDFSVDPEIENLSKKD